MKTLHLPPPPDLRLSVLQLHLDDAGTTASHLAEEIKRGLLSEHEAFRIQALNVAGLWTNSLQGSLAAAARMAQKLEANRQLQEADPQTTFPA